jgi:hypothetical protein
LGLDTTLIKLWPNRVIVACLSKGESLKVGNCHLLPSWHLASSVLASCLGVYVSFFLNAATGACIVLAQAGMFAGAMVCKNTVRSHQPPD